MPLTKKGYGCGVFSSFPTICMLLNMHSSVIREGNMKVVFNGLLVRLRMSSVITRLMSKGTSREIACTYSAFSLVTSEEFLFRHILVITK